MDDVCSLNSCYVATFLEKNRFLRGIKGPGGFFFHDSGENDGIGSD